MVKNDRKIVDLKTGVELEQYKMFKILFERSGMKRNEWHNKAQRLVGRSLGSPTKISDIFNGQSRSLPMRDIVPYIQALGMKKRETDYYIGEFFKAYCDENLHQYINTRSKTQQILMLEQRLKVKDFELTMLKKEHHRLRHVDTPLTIFQESERLKSEFSKVQPHTANTAEVFPFLHQDKNQSNGHGNDLAEDDFNSGFHEHHSKMEELSYESFFWEEALPLLHWFVVLNLIKFRRDDSIFIKFVSLYIPENFFSLMTNFQDESAWSPPEFRSNLEVVAEILADFRSSQPEQFKEEYESRKSKEDTFIRSEGGGFKIHTEIYKKRAHFKNYIASKYESKLENLPKEAGFLKICPYEPNNSDLIDYIFDQYLGFDLSGMSYTLTLDELFKLQNPFACVNQLCDLQLLDNLINVTQRKVEFVCEKYGHENPLNQYTKHPDFPRIFCKDYNAGQKTMKAFIKSFLSD